MAITTAATVLGVATATTADAQADSVSENPVVASASAQSTSSSSQQVMLATASESSATDSATSANVTNSASVTSQVSATNVGVSAVATVEAASSAVVSSGSAASTSTSVQAVSSVSNAVSSSATTSQEADSASAVREVASVVTSGKKSGWVTNASGQKVYYNTNGTTDTGREYVQLPSLTDTTKGATGWYLLQDGVAQKGAQEWYGSEWYFDPSTCQLLKENTYRVEKGQKVGYLVNSNGNVLSGVQKWMGTYYYFDPSTNLLLDHQDYVKSQWGYYYMVGSNGALVTGPVRWQGSLYYFDPSSYLLKTSGWAEHNHYVYYVNSGDQKLVTGTQTIGGVRYTFDSNGALYSFTRRTIEWFLNREGKLTYSMLGSRNGTDGTADFSGAMTQALRSAGASAPVASAQRWGGYNTISIRPWLIQNGYSNVFNGTSSTASSYSPQYGDIVIWDDATGGDGHILIIADGSGSGATALSVCYYTEGEEGTAVQELNYNYYYNYAESPSFHVYRPNNWLRA
ncbi:peptidoglycan amidohydrolase family protein [Limosilactobacillus fermentum]|uniref:peptidoglycan amidohydrolase family protein n=1 Tax=Limosilactobacillus fermentum TaxID=1613 RepID=UPI0021105030|nr:peptidoglycan amidohydrolase family protein [Limosilactobacillus fermentum]UUC14949.1 hypothetical protein NOV98_08160 [Limosilactobacillus fermentum]